MTDQRKVHQQYVKKFGWPKDANIHTSCGFTNVSISSSCCFDPTNINDKSQILNFYGLKC